ncbi:MAG TPA: hypothetical protein VKV25_03610 [Acidimicrobiales bacterium]|nr:hypothetical protein [Acidimicrobiales bacterium]
MADQRRRRRPALLAGAAALSMLAGACGSSGPAKSAGTGSSSAVAQIRADWTTFFKGSTPNARRVALLQDGSQFAQAIAAQSKSGLAKTASAKVTKVTVTSPTKAKVEYSISDEGVTALPHQSGVAVKQGGTWKVGDASFCALLTLEAGGKTSGLPAACSGAS